MSEHVRAQNMIAAYVAGGLDPAERTRLELHLAACPECVGLLDEARALDRKLLPLFAAAHPGPALEDRLMKVIQALPPVLRYRPIRISGKSKIALGAAAAVLFAFVGLAVDRIDNAGSLEAEKERNRVAGLSYFGNVTSKPKWENAGRETETSANELADEFALGSAEKSEAAYIMDQMYRTNQLSAGI